MWEELQQQLLLSAACHARAAQHAQRAQHAAGSTARAAQRAHHAQHDGADRLQVAGVGRNRQSQRGGGLWGAHCDGARLAQVVLDVTW